MADTPLTPEERMERAEGNAASETYAEVVPIEKAANGLLRHQLLTFGQVLDLPPPEPLVEGWIDKATLNVIYGKPKLGKTFVGLDLALCVATGAYWHGVPVEKTNVLYIAAEGVPYYPPRLRAWQAVNNIHNAPEGWFPTSLSRKDKKLYVKYVNEYGQPGNRWVDGTPRNPMPEIREQDIFDSTVGSWNNPATPEANAATASVREKLKKNQNMKPKKTKMGMKFGN